ncbi:MAG: sulfatase-like hydrolase/transferase [Akkermansiaceae bacterium]
MKKQLSLILLAVTTLIPNLQAQGNEPQEQPNFVWIISEDNSKHHLKLFDKDGVATPNIEALAQDGVIFDNACSNGAVCSVARSTLLTGCYAPRIGAQYHRKQALTSMPKELNPFPQYLKDAGYTTVNLGKTDYNVKVDMKQVWSSTKKLKSMKAAQPFFLNYSSLKVCHESSGHFKMESLETNPLNDLVKTINLPPHHPDTKIFRYSYAHYQDRIQKMDREVGEIIANLKADGVYENTIIFYFGDHGGILPRSKGYAYETGLHAPLVIRVPEKWKHLIPFEKGSRTPSPVNFYDFGPSLIHAAGIPLAKGFDGSPFLGKDVTAESIKDRPQFGYADRFDEKYDLVRTLRHGKFKYMRNYQPFNQDALHSFYRYNSLAYKELRKLYQAGKLNDTQKSFFMKKSPEAIYDLEADPYELTNLADDPNYKTKVREMRSELTAYLKKKNDLSFIPENILIDSYLNHPIEMGKSKHEYISSLIDLADLQLESFETAKPKLLEGLKSEDDLTRYWASITATYFAQINKQSDDFTLAVREQLKNEQHLLVKTRLAEYLAHIGDASAVQVIEQASYTSQDKVELNLILNSAAMIYEMDRVKFKFQFDKTKLKVNSGLIKERLKYLR